MTNVSSLFILKLFTMKCLLLQVAILLTGLVVNAQQAFRNTGNFQIHPGGIISGNMDFTNASSRILVNNGTLYLNGNIVNDEVAMSAGTSTLHINGSSAQVLSGTAPFRAFNIITNNPAGITLNQNLQVSGVHQYSNGL